MFKSIFHRLFLTHFLTLLSLFLVISIIVSLGLKSYIMQKQSNDILEASRLIERWTGYYQIDNNTIRSNQSYKERINDCATLLNCEIIVANPTGNVFDSTNSKIAHVSNEYIDKIMTGDIFKEISNFGGLYGEKVFTVGVPLEYKGNIIGGIYFNSHMPDIEKRTTHPLLLFIFAFSAALIIASMLVYFQAKKIANSLRKINTAALDIAAGNFPEKLPVTSKDEIGQLCSSFNFMSSSLQKLENMRSRFLSDVSHELRTPMTSISGFIQGILDGTIPPEKHKEYLKIAHDESSRLARLVSDMLEMTKMSSSEYKLNTTEFEFNELIRLCIISLGQKIEERNLDLEVNFDKDVLNVCADKDSIQRVLINLIDNAIKFSKPETTIQINTWIENKKAHFSISNYGKVISKEDLTHIFDRFYKADIARNDHKTGAGLGLSFVKNIMLLHKQTISVKSVPTQEDPEVSITKFTFTLELA